MLFAHSRPLAIRDALLVAVSVSAITVAAWPAGPAKQSFTIHAAAGQAGAGAEASTYALRLDDPRLRQLRSRMELWGEVTPSAELAVAHWRLCLAQHYADHTNYQSSAPASSDRVVQVAYADRQPTSGEVAQAPRKHAVVSSANPATQAYWLAAGERAAAAVQTAQQRMSDRRALAGPPPVVFGEILRGPKSPWSLCVAAAAGLLTAFLFSLWQRRWPELALLAASGEPAATEPARTEPVSDRSSSHDRLAASDDVTGTRALRIEIPAQWIGVIQPPAVQLRRICVVTLVLTALFTTAIQWL